MVKKKGKVKKKGDLKLKNRRFWIFLAIIFLLSVLTILNFLGDSNVTGHAFFAEGKHVQTIAYMEEGQLDFEIRNIDGLNEATLQLIETVKGGKVFFEEDDSIPFDRNYYSKFKVSSTEEKKYRGLRLLMKIKERDLLNAGISKEDLRLFVNGNELPTTFVKREDGHLFYKATAFEFGDFVIGKVIPTMIIEDVSEEELAAAEEELDQVQEEIESDSLVGKAAGQAISKSGVVFGNGLILLLILLIAAAIVITIFVGKKKNKLNPKVKLKKK